MASITTVSSSSTSSALLRIKLANLSLTSSPLSLPTHDLSKSFIIKPLKLFNKLNNNNNTHFPNPLLLLSTHHHHHHNFIPEFSAFESFEADQDDNFTTTPPRDDLQSEPDEEQHDEQQEIEQEKPINESNNDEGGRLYVGNLPYSMTSFELTQVFQEAGRVANVEIIYDRVTDRSRGFGFVTMATVEEAKEAIKIFNESQIGGRTVRVNFPEVPKGGEKEVIGTRIRTYRSFIDSPHKIYAGNLGWRLTSQGLRDAFANQPGILSAKVIYERDTGRSRGFGFVSFHSAEDAEAALNAMNGVEVEGRPLRLNMAAERARPPSSTKANTEDNLEKSEVLSGVGS